MDRTRGNLLCFRSSVCVLVTLDDPRLFSNGCVARVAEIDHAPVFAKADVEQSPDERVYRVRLARSRGSDAVVKTRRNEHPVQALVVFVGILRILHATIRTTIGPDNRVFPFDLHSSDSGGLTNERLLTAPVSSAT